MPDETREIFPKVRIVNLGGATETAIWSCFYEIDTVDPQWPSIPYGRPLRGSRYYILDEQRRPTALDEAGQIYTAGDSLALGYHGDPAQTARSFVPDPFRPGQRMYASGDRGRWRADGQMQLLGRIDHQVKVRGYRVELEEIEAVMASAQNIRSAVVVTCDREGNRTLASFYTCRGPGTSSAEIRELLASHLPPYMIPSQLGCLDKLPLTPNGKVDRAALAQLVIQADPTTPPGGHQ